MLDRRNLVYRQGWEISLFDIVEKNYSNDSRIIIWDMLDRDNYFEESRNFCHPVRLWVGTFFFSFYRFEANPGNKNDRFCRIYLRDIVSLEKIYERNKFY